MNLFKTTMLLTGLTVLLVLVGSAIGGKGGMIIALGFAVVMNFGSYWYSDKLVLKMHGARRVSEADAPQLYGIVRELSQRAKLPMPAVYIMASDTPNAFATGRNPEHAAVAATQGLLRIMNRDELRGVLAHELAHVRHRDILIGSIAATFAGAIAMLANIAQFSMIFGGGRDNNNGGLIGSLAMIFLAPLAASLIQMAVSRSREYAADAGGAEISGDAMGLASALRKLEQGNHAHPMESAERNPSTAHMFIVNPLFGGKFGKLFSTHPDTAERIRRLEAIARGA